MKRGVELSMNVIIIAAIALIVLVVLVILVTRGGINIKSGTGCQSRGGTCYTLAADESCQSEYNMQSLGESDCGKAKQCCYNPV